jgi:hypothetical protein
VIEGKPQACLALLSLFLKLHDQAEPYTSTKHSAALNKDKKHARHPLITHIFRKPESSIAGPACFGLSSLSSLSSHISTTEPKRAEDLKETAALRIPSKGPKGSNFIEFYENRNTTPAAMVVGTRT